MKTTYILTGVILGVLLSGALFRVITGSVIAPGSENEIPSSNSPPAFQQEIDCSAITNKCGFSTGGSSGSGETISLGGVIANSPCFGNPSLVQIGGAPVLLSDGTVKVPADSGFALLNPLFGSLPAGDWKDVEGFYSETPAGCYGNNFPSEGNSFFQGCAVNINGEVYCAKGQVQGGTLSGQPWTLFGDAKP